MTIPDVAPILVREIELTEPLSGVRRPKRSGRPYESVRFLVRLARRPIGYATVGFDGDNISPEQLAHEIWEQVKVDVATVLVRNERAVPAYLPVEGLEGLPFARRPETPMVSVVMCTRNRPEGAYKTLKDLCNLGYEDFEVIVVDNASSDDATKEMVERDFSDDRRVRYVRENKPGLSFARNRGIAEARGSIVAYTDDDVRVDRWWLDAIVSGFFQSNNVGCVTGLVPTAELETAVEQYFDSRYTWGTRFDPVVYDYEDKTDGTVIYPYSPGIFGTGANFAFDLATIKAVGGFDESLGAGTPSGGGEDLDAFIKVLRSGKELVQEPAAIIWHVHRATVDELSKQLFNYGVGLSAFIFKYLINPATTFAVLKRLVPGVLKLGSIAGSATSTATLPKAVLAQEFKGMAYGPVAYVKGQLNRKRIKAGARG